MTTGVVDYARLSAVEKKEHAATRNIYLEHLDEWHAQIKVGHIAAYQTQTKEDANRHDGV